MQKSNIFYFFINTTLCFLSLTLLNGCGSTSNTIQKDRDFNFILKYGVDARNILNTFEGTYTKDMVVDSSITITFSLSKDELDSIKSEMEEIKIFEYPEKFEPNENDDSSSNIGSTYLPFKTFYFKIRMGEKEKEITWIDYNHSKARKAIKLRILIYRIKDLIESKEEYKKLPPPNGGYL
jgi:hypothetical protein